MIQLHQLLVGRARDWCAAGYRHELYPASPTRAAVEMMGMLGEEVLEVTDV